MEKDDKKLIVILGLSLSVTLYAIDKSIRTHREERANRKKIREDQKINLEAIAKAGQTISERLDRGEYDGSLPQVLDNLNEEIEFQKIALRFNR